MLNSVKKWDSRFARGKILVIKDIVVNISGKKKILFHKEFIRFWLYAFGGVFCAGIIVSYLSVYIF